MNILCNYKDELIVLKIIDEKNEQMVEQNIGIIDVDYSLIRYIGNQLALQEVRLSNSNYLMIKREDNTYTTLHRFVLEYYAKFDINLGKTLQDKKLEINHKNKDRLDNRICNLEIVTHRDNINHMYGLEYKTIMNSEKLHEIQQKSFMDKQQGIDKEYLSRISGLFYKSMKTGAIEEKILKCCYYKLKNIKVLSYNAVSTSLYSNKFQPVAIPKMMFNFPTKSIQKLLQLDKQLIYRTIIKNNISLLNKYIDKYPYIRKILTKYKLVDRTSPNNNILIQIYEYAYNSNKFTINNGNILLVLSIKNCFKVVGKYKAFIILYLLGILQRQKYINKIDSFNKQKYPHIPSFIWIVPLKDEDFKQINIKAKELLKFNWNSVRYFMVAEEFGEDVANSIYSNNKRCKINYKYSLKAKEDIINMLIMDKAVFLEGYITRKRIFDYVKELNTNRKQNKANYSRVYKEFYNFISSILLYNTDIKKILEEIGLTYITLNTKIIKNIKQYQKQNGIPDTTYTLKSNMKVIVLKKLI